MLILPSSISCPWGGLGYIGCSSSLCISWIKSASTRVIAHELGHNAGMHHSGTDTNGNGVYDEGVDSECVCKLKLP